MKKLLAILAFVAVVVACQNPTSAPTKAAQTETHTLIVKNSLWQTVKTQAVTVARSLASDKATLQAEIDAYNALYTSDYQWVYEDNAPDLDHAPDANVFICNPQTNIPNWYKIGISRRYLVENWAAFQYDAQGQALYIDHIPDVPVLAKDTTPYEWYAFYIIEDEPIAGVKLFEDHAGYNSDETWSGQWITTPEGQSYNGTPGGGWRSVDAYYDQLLSSWSYVTSYPQGDFPGVTKAHIVTRQIYPPLPPIITDPNPVTP